MRRYAVLFLLCFFVFPLTATSANTNRVVKGEIARTDYPLVDFAVEDMLRDLPDEWAGVPYRYGGVTRRGIDCSAFVQSVYRDKFGIEIPRTTGTQKEVGISVGRHELIPGDLIIFRSGYSRSSRHVGIYVGDDEFVHISSSRRSGGVKVVNLTRFLSSRSLSFLDARRVVEVLESVTDVPENELEDLDISDENESLSLLGEMSLPKSAMLRMASEVTPINEILSLEVPSQRQMMDITSTGTDAPASTTFGESWSPRNSSGSSFASAGPSTDTALYAAVFSL